MIPLAYAIQIDSQVPGNAPALAVNQPHSTEHGSVEGELVAWAAHTHALYRDDISVVCYHMEEATRGTSYAASIKPFQKGKDGRGHGRLLLANVQARTSGKLKSSAKNNFSIQEFGKDRVIFHLRTSFPNTGMPLSPCKPVQSMCSINSQMSTEELDFYLKQFNALTLDSRKPWQVPRLIVALKA